MHLKIIMFFYYVEKFKMYKLCIKCTDIFAPWEISRVLFGHEKCKQIT